MLRQSFSEQEFEPLDTTVKISSEEKLDKFNLPKLLATFGKVDNLVIPEPKREGTLRFTTITSAVRAYFDFKAKEGISLEFVDDEIQKHVSGL